MIVSFYNKDFLALQNNASLNVGNYTMRLRAVDFDDVSITSEAFTENINPCFVVLKSDLGNYEYGGFAGIPSLDKEGRTVCQVSDLRTFFNSEILLKFISPLTVKDVFDQVYAAFSYQVIQSSFFVTFDTSQLGNLNLETFLSPDITTFSKYNCWELLNSYCKFYNLFIEAKLVLSEKKIVYTVKRIRLDLYNNTQGLSPDKLLPLKLWEQGISKYGKWIASVNEAQGIVINTSTNIITYGYKFIMLSNSIITTIINDRDIYPIKRKIFIKEIEDVTDTTKTIDEIIAINNANKTKTLNEANLEALTEIVDNRYNESIEIQANGVDRYEKADFETIFNVSVEKNVPYKWLPLGEIYKDNKGVIKLKIGYKSSDIVYYF
jgi:hypothetical protein